MQRIETVAKKDEMTKIKKVTQYTKKEYICPHCGEKQNSILEWYYELVAYEVDLKTLDSEPIDSLPDEFENYACPTCGGKLLLEGEFEQYIISGK